MVTGANTDPSCYDQAEPSSTEWRHPTRRQVLFRPIVRFPGLLRRGLWRRAGRRAAQYMMLPCPVLAGRDLTVLAQWCRDHKSCLQQPSVATAASAETQHAAFRHRRTAAGIPLSAAPLRPSNRARGSGAAAAAHAALLRRRAAVPAPAMVSALARCVGCVSHGCRGCEGRVEATGVMNCKRTVPLSSSCVTFEAWITVDGCYVLCRAALA